MIKNIAQSINNILTHPNKFPMGKFGIIVAGAVTACCLPILATHSALKISELARSFFGDTIGALTFTSIAGGMGISAILIREELDKINYHSHIKPF